MNNTTTKSIAPFRLARWISVCLLWAYSSLLLAGEAVWIDVRTAAEYEKGHVPAAVNIPYDEIESGISALDLQSDQTIYLYCGSGRRAGLALETLESMGYTQAKNLGGLEDAEAFAAEQSDQ